MGVAQVPLGLAGPLLVNGEHAQGEFYVPMATAEGTLVASYNRGMRVLTRRRGEVTVIGDAMQRAPVFMFEHARGARDFGNWVEENIDPIKAAAERHLERASCSTSSSTPSRILFTRFNYTTGDAAGQNMVGRATFAACSWILENYAPGIEHFFLESNFATDKKASQINVMRTRGKRVVAEAVMRDALMRAHARTAPLLFQRARPRRGRLHFGREQQRRALGQRHHRHLHRHRPGRRQRGRVLGRAGVRRAARERRLYYSITIPSLIVATHGGGTGLATQHECLQVLGCWRRHGAQVCRDRGRHGAVRRAIAGLGRRGRGVGRRARPART